MIIAIRARNVRMLVIVMGGTHNSAVNYVNTCTKMKHHVRHVTEMTYKSEVDHI